MCNAYNHPPGCTCGWGGDGHAGRSDGAFQANNSREPRTAPWDGKDFCRATTCPIKGCHPVYFIRHNGGSVWVDELGWPWPKHACFDEPSEPTRTFSTWATKSSGLTNPKLGIVIQFQKPFQHTEPLLIVRLTDSSVVSVVLRWTPPEGSLLGALVVLSKEDNMLLHEKHAEIPIQSYVDSQPMVKSRVKCPHCHDWIDSEDWEPHEAQCRERHGLKPRTESLPRSTNKRNRPSRQRDFDYASEATRIAREAWKVAEQTYPPEKRLIVAKQQALVRIRALPHPLRGLVEQHMTSQKWAPLLACQPHV